jgi:rRNA maturation protein Rpf1
MTLQEKLNIIQKVEVNPNTTHVQVVTKLGKQMSLSLDMHRKTPNK